MIDLNALKNIDISAVLRLLGVEQDSKHSFFCCNSQFHKSSDKTSSLKVNPKANYCYCFGCGLGGDTIKTVEQILNIDFKSACQWLEEHFSSSSNTYCATHKNRTQNNQIDYKFFDKKQEHKHIVLANFTKSYKSMSAKQKMMFLYTYVYRFSLTTKQDEKINFYKSRGITNCVLLEHLGFLNKEDIKPLCEQLLKIATLDELIEFKLLNENSQFKYGYNNIVVPSFHLYNDLCTGLMLRRTYECKCKEINISCSNLISPMPFGLTNKLLQNAKEIVITEGHCDGLVCFNELKKSFISISGVNNFKECFYSLLANKNIVLALDNDEAGKQATQKLIKGLIPFAKSIKIALFDSSFGKDLNDLLLNKKLNEITYKNIKN